MQDIRRKTVAAILAGGAASAGEIVDVKDGFAPAEEIRMCSLWLLMTEAQ